ncbi:MAG: pentapeptide repeat-containing protein [Planctomycetota bacterium]|jgi:uncharacterized protein YjbI with pentapeptide repeats
MGNGDTVKEPRNKTIREWVRAIGTFTAGLGILIGLLTLWFTKEKEASDRLLNIINLLDNKNCKMVRAGAASTIGVYLGDYKEYQDRAFWVMANNLASEDDPLVRDNILNILKGATANAIEPLACMNRFLVAEEMRRLSFFLFSIDLAFLSHLNEGDISKELRQEFVKNNVRLSENTSVLIAEKGSRWLINNKDDGKKYTIRKEEDKLDIYGKDELADMGGLNSGTEFANLLLNNKLRDITVALAAVLEKESYPKEGKRYLQNTIISNFDSPTKIHLDDTNFEHGDLSCVRMKGVSLKQANLKHADFEKAFLWSVDLKRADLQRSNLEFANFYEVDLTDAIMCGANLFSATLESSILKGADLASQLIFAIDAMEYQIDIDKGTISKELQQEFENNGIKLADNARLEVKKEGSEYFVTGIIEDYRMKCRISKEQGKLNVYSDTILDFANLQENDLTGTLLTNASLQGAALSHANMERADLKGADLFEADLTNANLADANLEGANLERAILKGSNIKQARNWQKAIFDDDIRQELMSRQN